MKKEEKRILKLYETKKISESEYKLLYEALLNRKTWGALFFENFINPFNRVAGWTSIFLGFLIIALISSIGTRAQIHFPGLFDLKTTSELTGDLSFQKILLQNMVLSLLLASSFYLSSLALKKTGLRFLDFIGMVMMARFPYLIATVLLFLLQLTGMNFHFDKVEDVNTTTLMAISFIGIFSLVWLGATYFFAFKESSGLKGRALWISFTSNLIFIEIASLFINHKLV